MLTPSLEKKLANDKKKPERRRVTICPYCNRTVEASPDAQYIKTKYSEHFFHGKCLLKAIKTETGGMV